MIIFIEKPQLKRRNVEEDLEIIDTWASNLTDKLNYALNHIDRDNIVPGVLESEVNNGSN